MSFKKFICIFTIFAVALTISCGPRSDETSPEMIQDMLKLRGFKFTEAEFFRAVNLEDAAAVRAFLQSGMNPNAKNEKGETALTYAIQYRDPKVIKVLLEKADVNMKDDLGNSPIHLAVAKKKEEIFDLLLEKNADVNVAGADGKTKNQTALYAAVLQDREDLVQKLIEKGADPNIADSEGAYPLSEAVVRADANPQIVKLILDGGANVNAQEPNKGTALIFVASHKQISSQARQEIVKMLLDKGADKSIKDKNGKTALDWAKQQGNTDVVEMLR
jgi:ankyrin repeat protein